MDRNEHVSDDTRMRASAPRQNRDGDDVAMGDTSRFEELHRVGAHDPAGEEEMGATGTIGMDLSMFDSSEHARRQRAREIRERLEKQKARIREQRTGWTRFINPVNLLLVLVVMAVCALTLTKYVRVTILNDQIDKLQSAYEELQKVNQDLQVQVDSRYDLEQVKEYATNILGMEPMDAGQLEYVELHTEEIIDVVGEDVEDPAQSSQEDVKGWLRKLWEALTGD